MSRYVTVRVMQADIAAGKTNDGASCPVALAARRAGYPKAYVGNHQWYPAGILRKARVRLTASAERWVDQFDDGKPVKPATFRLPLP